MNISEVLPVCYMKLTWLKDVSKGCVIYCNILYWIEFHVTSGRNYTNIYILLGLELFHNLNHGKIWMLEQEFQTWGLCWQSQRNDKTYNPGSISSGISTKSLKTQWLWWCGRFTMAHSDPSGVVPTFVLTIGLGTAQSSGRLPGWLWSSKSLSKSQVQVMLPKILYYESTLIFDLDTFKMPPTCKFQMPLLKTFLSYSRGIVPNLFNFT